MDFESSRKSTLGQSKCLQMSEVSRNARQFSIRDLLKLTLVVSIALTIAVLSRGSLYAGALASPWAWVSFAMIGAVWIVGRRTDSRRWLVRGSILGYFVSMAAPAIGFGTGQNAEIAFGGQVWLQS